MDRQTSLLDRVNHLIHRENLYLVTTKGNRRVIDAHVGKDGSPVVTDLHSEEEQPIRGSKFVNGYGTTYQF